MNNRNKYRRWVRIGGWIGGLLALGIAFMEDILFSDALQGTWFDAIAGDLNKLFGTHLSPHHPMVYIFFAVVLVLLFFIGMFLGMFFTLFIYRFMEFLTSDQDAHQ